jgi:hypothetical protein
MFLSDAETMLLAVAVIVHSETLLALSGITK